MESLNSLASSLPTPHHKAEQELLNNFKAAALSITTLYRSSRETSKRAYDAGYAAACQDLLNMIQHGVSAGGIDNGESREGVTIGRVMDWTEARLEALKQKDEEEEEDEEREKERKPSTASAAPASAPPSVPKVSKSASQNISNNIARLKDAKVISPISEPSNSPVIPTSAPLIRPPQRPMKPRPSTKGDGSSPYVSLPPPHPFDFITDPRQAMMPMAPSNMSDGTLSVSAGVKRRHAMMMMLDAAAPPVSMGGGTSGPPSSGHHMSNLSAVGNGLPLVPALGRRRARSSRVTSQQQQALNLLSAEAMDVEEENGRDRKRVARR
ncbi:hypothetical protein AX14_009172 [Amanita brunnescens Koide BX004]|nr:hypothetical protein AX14_012305 [Amanita brunnescens Koide BX004]KAF8723800.1 hypothetical protein AX14_009172 [Amanita brunnescens Koide BX004]